MNDYFEIAWHSRSNNTKYEIQQLSENDFIVLYYYIEYRTTGYLWWKKRVKLNSKTTIEHPFRFNNINDAINRIGQVEIYYPLTYDFKGNLITLSPNYINEN